MLYQMILGDVSRPLNRDYIFVLESRHVCRELIDLISRSIASDRSARFQHAGDLAGGLKALPKKLIAEPDSRSEHERLYATFDRFVCEARELNDEAQRLFEQRRFKDAEDCMNKAFHPALRDQELDKAIRLYAEGKRLRNILGMEFVWVPPGDSWLGGGGGTPGNRKITVEKGFWAGVYPVTQAEWKAVLGDDPSQFKGNPRFPVESVSWDRVTNEFLIALNKKCQGDGYQYRLPTEEEWEYVCRGRPISQAQSAFHYYFAQSKTDLTPAPTNELTPGMACFGQGASGRPSEVGSFLPNTLGVHDMHGLIWEWTTSSEGPSRVFRGGSWWHPAGSCAAAYRDAYSPGNAHHRLGFRLLAVPLAGK
jgi:formylglycine-generating enzyme required for sulfatase activity